MLNLIVHIIITIIIQIRINNSPIEIRKNGSISAPSGATSDHIILYYIWWNIRFIEERGL